jgi:hypothetical protein
MLHEFEMFSAVFTGCSVGLVDPENKPIKKPWRVATTSKTLAAALSEYPCKCIVPLL